MQMSASEPFIYIEQFARTTEYDDSETSTTIIERRPLDQREVWIEYSSIPDTPPAQSAYPGTTSGVVSGIAEVALTQVSGEPNQFESTAGEFLDMVPTSVSSGNQAYQPTLTDSNDVDVPYNPAVWVADGLNEVINFPAGVPDGIVPPFLISYWRYIGSFAVGGTPTAITLSSVGTGETLVNDGVSPTLAVKSLVAGTGVTLSSTGTEITITSPSSDVTLASAGGTEGLVVDGLGPSLTTKGLTAGTGISLSGAAAAVTIAATGANISLSSAGGTESLLNDGTGPTLATKGLTAGTGISLTGAATAVTIATTVSLSSAGGVESLVNDGTAPTLATKGLTAGTGISLTGAATLITIAATGTNISLSSAGGTETLVNDGTGPTLATKGLTAGTGISLTGAASAVTIINSSPASSVALTSAGGTETLVNDGTGPALATKGLTAGTGISLTGAATAVTIATTVALSSAGGTESLVNDGTAPTLATKGLTAGTGISLTGAATAVTIINASPATSVTLGSAGGTETLVSDGTGPTLATKGLTAGTGISLTGAATLITIAATGTNISLSSAGGVETLVNNGTGPTLATKGLTAGTGISLTGAATLITIAATGSNISLSSAGGTETLVNDGTGPTLATKGLTAGTGITLTGAATAVTIAVALAHNQLSNLTNDDHPQYVTLLNRGAETVDINAVKTDGITESTTDAGVTVEGILIKDSEIFTDKITEVTSGGVLMNDVVYNNNQIVFPGTNLTSKVKFRAGLTFDIGSQTGLPGGQLEYDAPNHTFMIANVSTMFVKSGEVVLNVLNELTTNAGVTIEGVLLKDNNVTSFDELQWTTSGQTIVGDAGGLTYNAPTGDNHSFAVNSVEVAKFDNVGLNLPLETATRVLSLDASKNASAVTDLTAWVGGGLHVESSSDGDGTLTLNVEDTAKQWSLGRTSATTLTFAQSDTGTQLHFTGAGASQAWTLNTGLTAGWSARIVITGTGSVLLGGTATLNTAGSLTLGTQYGVHDIIYITTNSYVVINY